MDALEKNYEQTKVQYDALIAENKPANLPKIQALNQKMSAILHDMLGEVATMKGNAANLQIYRDELMTKLVKVQNDSSIMMKQKDQYETLKMLQGHEQEKFDASFYWYAFALGFAAVIFAIVLMWKGHTAPAIPTMMSSPTTTPAFI